MNQSYEPRKKITIEDKSHRTREKDQAGKKINLVKQADLKKKEEKEATAKKKELTQLKLHELLRQCRNTEKQACHLKEAKKDREELLTYSKSTRRRI